MLLLVKLLPAASSCAIFVLFSQQSKEECEYLIELAKPQMVKSSVVDSETGLSKDSRCFSFAFIIYLGKICAFSSTFMEALNVFFLGFEQVPAHFCGVVVIKSSEKLRKGLLILPLYLSVGHHILLCSVFVYSMVFPTEMTF